MPEKKREPEIEALEAVHAALKPLRPEERSKVLASVFALLGIQGTDLVSAPAAASTPVARPAPAAVPAESTGRPQASPLLVNELVKDKSPGTNAQRIALFAYYRDKHEAIPRFGRNDLKAYFAKAKEHPPTNYDRDFVEAVKKGWIHEDGDESYITSKGIESVESGFPGARKYTKGGRATRKRRAKGRSRPQGQRKTRGAR